MDLVFGATIDFGMAFLTAMAAHLTDREALDADLFARIDGLYRMREMLELDPEELRLLERYHLDFVRAGAQLGAAEKERYAALTERLAEEAWQQVICHEGMDEELRSHFAALRVRPAYGDARRSAFPSPGRRTSCS